MILALVHSAIDYSRFFLITFSLRKSDARTGCLNWLAMKNSLLESKTIQVYRYNSLGIFFKMSRIKLRVLLFYESNL